MRQPTAALILACAACGSTTPQTAPDAGPDAGVGVGAGPIDAAASVLQHHNDAARDGLYVDAAFTRAGASSLARDLSFTAQVQGSVRAQPLFLSAGARDLLFVATEKNQVSALDAKTGNFVWQRTLGAPIPLSALPCGNIDPLGITGTPIIDVASRTLFLDAMLDQGGQTPHHQIFGLSIDDGTTRAGYPIDVDAHVAGFHSLVQNQRGALAILGGKLFVPYGGHYGDCGAYRGVVVAVTLANQGVTGWQTRAQGGGIWAVGGLASDGTSIYAATGNTIGANTFGDGESIIRLSTTPSSSGATADEFTPANWRALDSGDIDLGGSAPLLFGHYALALGKDSNAYLLDRGNLSTALSVTKVATEEIIGAGVSWQSTQGRYVAFSQNGNGCSGTGLTALRITPPGVQLAWCKPMSGHGSAIVVSPDGQASFTLFVTGAEGDERLHGFDGDTGSVVYSGTDALGTVERFDAPIVAKGRLYLGGVNQVLAFAPR